MIYHQFPRWLRIFEDVPHVQTHLDNPSISWLVTGIPNFTHIAGGSIPQMAMETMFHLVQLHESLNFRSMKYPAIYYECGYTMLKIPFLWQYPFYVP